MVTTKDCETRSVCRAGGQALTDVFELGDICLNDFVKPDAPDSDKYPLTLAFSQESKLVQLRHTVDPELMFRNYWYNSGTNPAMAAHLEGVVRKAINHTLVRPGDTVIDIGCNDGTLLGFYPEHTVKRIGYDPAKNIEPKNCDMFINEFFGAGIEAITFEGKARIVTSIAMFYDLDNPQRFARDVARILTDDGVWVLEMHYLPDMLKNNEVDAICHEHLCYYSLSSLNYVLQKAGLQIIDVEFNKVNGGSMLVFVKKNTEKLPVREDLAAIMIREYPAPLIHQLVDFAKRVESNKETMLALLRNFKREGKKVYGYGASTKGNTILQYYGIGPELLPYIADRNPQKHGLETVGSRIPIISEEEMRAAKPDYLLVLPYHFIDAFREREQEFLARGGKFIVPVPTPQVVS